MSLFASAFLFWALLLASRTTFRVSSSGSASHLDGHTWDILGHPGTGCKTFQRSKLCFPALQLQTTTKNSRHIMQYYDIFVNCLHGGNRHESVPQRRRTPVHLPFSWMRALIPKSCFEFNSPSRFLNPAGPLCRKSRRRIAYRNDPCIKVKRQRTHKVSNVHMKP